MSSVESTSATQTKVGRYATTAPPLPAALEARSRRTRRSRARKAGAARILAR